MGKKFAFAKAAVGASSKSRAAHSTPVAGPPKHRILQLQRMMAQASRWHSRSARFSSRGSEPVSMRYGFTPEAKRITWPARSMLGPSRSIATSFSERGSTGRRVTKAEVC